MLQLGETRIKMPHGSNIILTETRNPQRSLSKIKSKFIKNYSSNCMDDETSSNERLANDLKTAVSNGKNWSKKIWVLTKLPLDSVIRRIQKEFFVYRGVASKQKKDGTSRAWSIFDVKISGTKTSKPILALALC